MTILDRHNLYCIMLKASYLCVLFSLITVFLYGYDKGERNLWIQNTEELPVLLQSNIFRADSLINSCASCWDQMEEKQLFKFSISLGYLCEISDNELCFDKLVNQFNLIEKESSLEALRIGIPLQFGRMLSEEERKRMIEFSNSNSRELKVFATYFLGLHTLNKDDFQNAQKFFKKVLQLSKNNKKDFLICKTFQRLSSLEAERQDYPKAFEYLLKSLDYAKKNELKFEQAYTDKLIGELLLKMDNQKEAEAYLKKGLSLSRTIYALKLEADILSNLGVIHLSDENKQSAIGNFSLALSKYYKLNYAKGIAQSHLRLGEVYKGSQSYKLSKDNYLLSQGYLEEINDSLQLGDAFYCLAEIEFYQSNFIHAKSYIEKSIFFRTKLSTPFDLHKAFLLSAQIKEKLGDHSSALRDLLRYTSFSDSVQDTDLKAKIAELNELYQAEQKENLILQQSKELEELTVEGELREQKLENIALRNRQIVFLLLVILFAGASVFVWFRFKRKQEKSDQLQQETELKQTLLRSQMNPHFIFNSMSVIQSYIYSKDTENSSLFIINFSRLMRLILENSSKEFIPLSTELEILEKYLLIQKLRFDGRFDFSIDTGELELENIHVPPMLTQPFIENAIEHGRLETIEGGVIRISFSNQKGLIKIVVEDNGVGKDISKHDEVKKSHKSMAIEITKERIELLNLKYKANGLLEIVDLKSDNSSGTRVTILTYFKNMNE